MALFSWQVKQAVGSQYQHIIKWCIQIVEHGADIWWYLKRKLIYWAVLTYKPLIIVWKIANLIIWSAGWPCSLAHLQRLSVQVLLGPFWSHANICDRAHEPSDSNQPGVDSREGSAPLTSSDALSAGLTTVRFLEIYFHQWWVYGVYYFSRLIGRVCVRKSPEAEVISDISRCCEVAPTF